MAATSETSRPLSWPLSWIVRWHDTFVHERRTRVLAEMLAAQIPKGAAVLDIGCGDGTIASRIRHRRPDVSVEGVELQVRPGCKIACRAFDGSKLPFPDASFDACLFVDVLHHTEDPAILLREAARVSRSLVHLKDHLDENLVDDATLRYKDWVGNRPYRVALTYNYQSAKQWAEHFSRCGLAEATWTTEVPLYPWPFSVLAGRRLHFVSLLRKMK
jgi:ubiquinone/menaquinone biosynthesis C-methylase UbiE